MTKKDDSQPITGKDNAEKVKNLLNKIRKDYGKEAVMTMDEKSLEPISVIKTGAITLDMALGIGGIPIGRVTEIIGEYSSGKSTLAQHIMANAQKIGGIVCLIDTEGTFDPSWAITCGMSLDNDKFIISQPDHLEQALDLLYDYLESDIFSVICFDSIAQSVPKSEVDGSAGEKKVGEVARLMGQALRKITPLLRKSNTAIILTNQTRSGIGSFGSYTVVPGGKGIDFSASIMMTVKKTDVIKTNGVATSSIINATIKKNKLAAPFKEAKFEITFGKGIVKEGGILDVGVELDIIDKGGSWYDYGETRLGQGREKAKQFLIDNPDICDEIENKILLDGKISNIVRIDEETGEIIEEISYDI